MAEMVEKNKVRMGLIVGNPRGFFTDHLATSGWEQMLRDVGGGHGGGGSHCARE